MQQASSEGFSSFWGKTAQASNRRSSAINPPTPSLATTDIASEIVIAA